MPLNPCCAQDYNDHIAEIENKLVALLSDMVQSHLSTWEIKPPVPSQVRPSIVLIVFFSMTIKMDWP